MNTTPARNQLPHRFAALLLVLGVAGVLGIGQSLPWHRHLLAGLELFHSHSHVGGHHHDELHALAERAGRTEHEGSGTPQGRVPGGSGDESGDSPPEPECALVPGGLPTLTETSIDQPAPPTIARAATLARSRVHASREPLLPSDARAPPA